jgi:ribose transport system ATP-binding protein
MGGTVAVGVRGVVKRFPGVTALGGVTLDFPEGSTIAVMGENGAGKSTLMSIIAGLAGPDEGSVSVRGVEVRHFDPHTLLDEHRVALVPQELALCEERTVAQNILLGAEPGFVPSSRAMRRRSRDLLGQLQVDLDPDILAGRLTVAEQQMIVLARGLAREAHTIIMDEPTAALTPTESGRLFELVERLRADGTTVIYVSHRLPEVFRLCQLIHVLRDGMVTATLAAGETTERDVVRAMVGRELVHTDVSTLPRPAAEAPPVLDVRGLSGRGFEEVDVAVRGGEVVGFAGLPDSGRDRLLAAIFGASRPGAGEIRVDGEVVDIKVPRDGIRAGIAYVPAERRREGILPAMSVEENLIVLDLAELGSAGFVSPRKARRLAAERVRRFDVRGRTDGAIANLSGGNQQKAVLARWIGRSPRVMLLDEPTRGVDVGAKAEIYDLIEDLAKGGAGVIFSSSDLPELLRVSMRICVMFQGRIVAELSRQDASEESILGFATGLAAA